MINITIIILFSTLCCANSQPIILNNCNTATYGYYYLDSDTIAPGAPVFHWVSIYNRGTRITGLSDDNVKGPIPIGFNFKYYWVTRNNSYIGSNGYISFDDDFLSAFPFQSLPSYQRPNNVIAPLMADLDFNVGTPSCWYWTNAVDTFIVEFDSVQFWSTGGLVTFQIILCRRDSSITFQYLTVQGNPAGGWSSVNSNTVGIENSLGYIGTQYLKDGLPVENILHSNLAIKFRRGPVAEPEIDDIRVVKAMNNQSVAIFLRPGNRLNIWAKFENSGTWYHGYYYPVCAKITDEQNSLVYLDTNYAHIPIPGYVDSVIFSDTWMPANTGRYCLDVSTAYTGDICPENDTIQVEVNVISNNAPLQYETGSNADYCWNRPAGFANQFVPPSYPWYIRGARIYASAPSPTNAVIKVYDDNGPGISPGDVLAQEVVTVTIPAWYSITFPDSVTINDGSFFIGATSSVANLSYGMDTIPPFSHRLWEYTGAWNLSRFSLNRDVCIRSLSLVGIEELAQTTLTITDISILPNPFRDFVTIRFANPLKENLRVRIYNSTGAMVRTLTTNEEIVIWNGRNENDLVLPNGCYFVRLGDDQTKSLTKVIITR